MAERQEGHQVVIQGLENSVDLFHALEETIAEYMHDASSARKAITCALFAWQLTDWVFKEYETGYKKLGEFQRDVRASCPSFSHMQAMITGHQASDSRQVCAHG